MLSVFLLVFELVAYLKGWHFSPPSLEYEIEYSVEYVYANWLKIRAYYLAPLLQNLTNACIVLFLIQSVDRFVLVLGCFYIKIRGLRPVAETDYRDGDEKEGADLESYPMVLVQIPMCNGGRYTNNLLEQYASRIGLRQECLYRLQSREP
ncbi:putative xyloglucan glycosyltransferase 6 [Salvia divinorum]|uniref:Xyloglucan glycosyltransferase 6 n=1 Tax=Salvia divinorum TaxID=28513 RepID=A0ABD1GKC4_SALDI